MLRFHQVHGSHVVLENEATVATRHSGFCNGLTFSATPLVRGEQYHLRVRQVSDWNGALRVGVTWHDPTTLTSLPRYSFPDLIRRPGFWVRTVREHHLNDGARVHFWLTAEGQLHVCVRHQQVALISTGVPPERSLWALIDVYGNTQSVQATCDEEAPLEIVARGKEARDLYRRARASGTVAVYRSRLVLVGAAGVGKTWVRHLLLGTSEEAPAPTAGLDTSGLFTFPVEDPSNWTSSETARPSSGVRSAAQRDPDEIEEEYQAAIARNVVRELLSERKSREMARRQTRASHRSFSSTFRVNLSRSSLNKVVPKKEQAEVTDEGAMKELPPEIVRLVEEMLTESPDTSREREAPADSRKTQQVSVNIWDWSGDPEYESVQLPLLGYRGVYLLPFDVSQPLDSPAVATSWREGKSSETTLPETRLERLLYTLQLVHAAATAAAGPYLGGVASDTGTTPPAVLMLAVWDDLVPPSEPQMQHARQQLREALESRLCGRHVHGQILALSLRSPDAGQLRQLRGCLGRLVLAQAHVGENVPVRWLRLEEELARRVTAGLVVATAAEIETIATEQEVVGQELVTFLQFYHDQGSLLCHGQGGGQLVLLSPQWLVQLFTDAINAKRESFQVAPGSWGQLEQQGVVQAGLLTQHWDDVTSDTVAIGVLQRLGIVCPLLPPQGLYELADSAALPRMLLLPSLMATTSEKTAGSPEASSAALTFYLDFNGCLPISVFHQLLVRMADWSQTSSHRPPVVAPLRAQLFVDSSHELLLAAGCPQPHWVQVTISRLAAAVEEEIESYPALPDSPDGPSPDVCWEVRRRLDRTLAEVRAGLCRRLQWRFLVACPCGRPCSAHGAAECPRPACLHTLPLSQCLDGGGVLCQYRPVPVDAISRLFQRSQPPDVTETPLLEPVLPLYSLRRGRPLTASGAPTWLKQTAKLLNAGAPGSDWQAVAKQLGYRDHKVSQFDDSLDPGLALLGDWLMASGNSSLSLELLQAALAGLGRHDVCAVLRDANRPEQPPPVFVSYQWQQQEAAGRLRTRLERAGLRCWMDVGQLGGGELLCEKIYQGISGAKVFVACLSAGYLNSQMCVREAHLADLLRLPIVPVLLEPLSWPPAGSLALVFSQLIYIDFAGVGSHGGCGRAVDWTRRADELVHQVASLLPTELRQLNTVLPPAPATEVSDTGTGGSALSSPLGSPVAGAEVGHQARWQRLEPARTSPQPLTRRTLARRLRAAAAGCCACHL